MVFPLEREKTENDSMKSSWKQVSSAVITILMARKQSEQKLWIQILQIRASFSSAEVRIF